MSWSQDRPYNGPQAPLGRRAGLAVYACEVAIAVGCLLFEPPLLLVLPILVPLVLGAAHAGRVEAKRRGIVERPFSRGPEAIMYGVLGAIAGGTLGGELPLRDGATKRHPVRDDVVLGFLRAPAALRLDQVRLLV